jgi:hypothetical protein
MKKTLTIIFCIGLLIAISFYAASLLNMRLWSVTGHAALEQGKAEWTQGHIRLAFELWFYAAQRTVEDTVNRDRAHSILRQSDAFLQEGKLSTALAYCKKAAEVYDEEGATSYHCMIIGQRINGTPTALPTASPPP